jgi:hypothetical protein
LCLNLFVRCDFSFSKILFEDLKNPETFYVFHEKKVTKKKNMTANPARQIFISATGEVTTTTVSEDESEEMQQPRQLSSGELTAEQRSRRAPSRIFYTSEFAANNTTTSSTTTTILNPRNSSSTVLPPPSMANSMFRNADAEEENMDTNNVINNDSSSNSGNNNQQFRQRTNSSNSLDSTTVNSRQNSLASSSNFNNDLQNNNNGPSSIFATQNPNNALNPPSRKIIIITILFFSASVLHLVGTFQPLFSSESSIDARKFFTSTLQLITVDNTSNNQNGDGSNSQFFLSLEDRKYFYEKDGGFHLTQWAQCFDEYPPLTSERMSTVQLTKQKIGLKQVCFDPTTVSNFCRRAKRMLHGDRAMQTFSFIASFFGFVFSAASFLGSRYAAKYSNRSNLIFGALGAIFALVAFVVQFAFLTSRSICSTNNSLSENYDSPWSLKDLNIISATYDSVLELQTSNNNMNNASSTTISTSSSSSSPSVISHNPSELLFSPGNLIPFTVAAFGCNLLVIGISVIASTRTASVWLEQFVGGNNKVQNQNRNAF